MEQNNEIQVGVYLSKDWLCLLALALFVFLLIFPVFYFGIPNGADFPQHYQFAFTYLESIKSGNFLPGWSPSNNYGFGEVGIRFYPPLAHYCLALTQLLTGDWYLTSWLNVLFWMLLGSLGIYLWAREWLSPQNSLWVGILYAVAPYHLSQFYQYFLYSEYVAAGILPFCFFYLTRVIRDGKFKNVLGLGFSSALLILSHIPTTIIGVICLGLYAILILDWKKLTKIIPLLFISGVLAVSSTAFYWSKLITEIGLVNHSNPKYASSYSVAYFPMIFHSTEYYFSKQMWYKDLVSISAILFILPLIVFLFWQRKKSTQDLSQKKYYLAVLLTGIFAFFMSSHLSSFIWDNISFLQRLQFPFRWLSVATLMGVMCFVIGLRQLSFTNNISNNLKKYAVVIFLFGIFLFDVSQVILPSETLPRPQFEERLNGLGDQESFDCWWTVWSKSEAFNNREKVSALSRQVSITRWNAEEREFEIEAGTSQNV
ncbi:MAG TPA: 6-pyruvoyl-tetrahydropterin synthase-related protein, partial [Pyrinomonadaceae bacterium]|nr:6-pyruvoyl-tetrahydropterin synthase-related protein [Pyrinomonadaceae bacterium]